MVYARGNNGGQSVTLGGPLFHLPALDVGEAEPDPFESYVVQERLLPEPTLLTPVDPLFSTGRSNFAAWSDVTWTALGADLEPEPATSPTGGSEGFTPEHFRAAISPLVDKPKKKFAASARSAARYQLLFAGAPPTDGPNPDHAVLPDLLP